MNDERISALRASVEAERALFPPWVDQDDPRMPATMRITIKDLADLLAERDRLLAVVEAVESLHRPTRVYDECTHDDCQAEQIEVYDYMACADSAIGWGCETCCYDDEFPIEECPHGADHRGVAEADSCPTHAAVRAYRAATTGEAGQCAPVPN